jgi:hypothetical protein
VTADEMREMQWVRPVLVAQMRFVEWTAEGRLRHAAFLGLPRTAAITTNPQVGAGRTSTYLDSLRTVCARFVRSAVAAGSGLVPVRVANNRMLIGLGR